MGTRIQILEAATELFAERGFYGASVRDITGRVGASANAISYHFGSKERLYQEIIERLASDQLELAERVLSTPARSPEEFAVRLEVFFTGLLECYLDNRDTIRIIFREFELLLPRGSDSVVGRMTHTNNVIAAFVREGIDAGLVRKDVDPDIVAGLLLDRVLNQARFTEAHKIYFNVSTLEETYRKHWIQSTLGIVLHGICGAGTPAA